MTDRHKTNPVTFRPPSDLRKRLTAYADRHDEGKVGRVIIRAVREFLDRNETTSPESEEHHG